MPCPPVLLVGCALLLASCSAPEPRHLLLLTVDTLRADRLGAYGSDLGLSPQLDRLAGEGVRFESAFAPAPQTLPSRSALLTGRHPEAIGVDRNWAVLPAQVPTLAEALLAGGFRTGAVVSNSVLWRPAGLSRGFERYDDRQLQREAVRDMPERVATATTDAALEMAGWLLGRGDRIFLWVHYQDPHGPYTPPEGYRERFLERERSEPDGRRRLPRLREQHGLGGIPHYQGLGDEDEVAWYRAGYHGEIRYLDDEIGRLLEGLAALGLDEDLVIAFTADHGEGLGEDGYWFAHGEYLNDASVRIPLVLRVPGRPPGVRSDVASLLDLAPTLGALLLDEVPGDLPGRDLLAPGADQTDSVIYLSTLGQSTLPRFGVLKDGHKYLVEVTDGRRSIPRLHPIGEEDRLVGGQQPETRRSLDGELRSIRTRMSKGLRANDQPLSVRERRRLQALGYLEVE